MKQIEKIASAENFDAVALGRMAGLGDYAVALSPEVSIPGKVFAGSALNATGRRDIVPELRAGHTDGVSACTSQPRGAVSVHLGQRRISGRRQGLSRERRKCGKSRAGRKTFGAQHLVGAARDDMRPIQGR